MVKIRGYRIELGEVEATLLALPGVHEAACVVVTADDGETSLEAFVVPARARPAEAELRRRCRETLPRYMVPDAIHVVDALPRTSTGKTDRTALVAGREKGRRDAN